VSARSRRRSLLVLTVFLAGCAPFAAPPPPVPLDARRAIALLEDRWREFSDLRTLADVVVQRGGDRQQARAVILAKAPDSVRFEALSAVGAPVLVATVHEGRLTAYDAVANEATVGPATADVAGRVLGLPFDPPDLVAVLAGHAVPPLDVRDARMRGADEVGPSVELGGPVNRRRVWMDLATGEVTQMEFRSGLARVRIRFRRDPSGRPAGFDLHALAAYLQAMVRYENPVFDSALPSDLFVFTPPKDAKMKEIR
jgi:outer membrane lipoprotein-sorting protein